MLDHRLSRSVLVGCAALAVLRAVYWLNNPYWLIYGKLQESIFVHLNDVRKWLSLAVCCAVAVWLWTRGRHSARAAPPAYPGALPLIGHVLQFLGDETHVFQLFMDLSYYSLEKGGVISMSVGVFPAYVITDPDDCLTIANTCLEKPYIYSFAKEWLGNGLLLADAITWKIHRKLLNPAFGQKMIKTFVEVFNEQSRKLVDQLGSEVGKGLFDPVPYVPPNALEMSCRTILNLNPEDDNICCTDYAKATEEMTKILLERFQKFWLHVPFIYNFSSLKKKHDKYCKYIADIGNRIVQKRKLELRETGAFNIAGDDAIDNCKSVLDLLLHLNEDQGVLSDSELLEHLNTFIFASYETTGYTIVYTLVLLGSHQHVQQRLYEELQEVIGDTDGNVDSQTLTKLVYLEAVLKESMRLYPNVPVVARKNQEDVNLRNYTIPAGGIYALSIYGVHRHPMWGADADTFRPERWLEPAGVPDNPSAFASFSLGRRNCIGKLYAMTSLKITLVHLLRRYCVTGDASKLVMKVDPILRPVSGHHISLKLRI